jgi:hypothetical protein
VRVVQINGNWLVKEKIVKADSLEANTDAEVFELKGHVDLITSVNDEEKL